MFRLPDELVRREEESKIYGVVVGIVTNNKDEDGQYRVRVRLPFLPNGETEETDWARVATVGAGKDRGLFWLPEVGDEVLVAFEHGDIARPYVVGSLWNGTSTSIMDNKEGKNDIRGLQSRSGHKVFMNDKKGEESVTVQTKLGHKLVMDDKAKTVTLSDHKGEHFITLDNKNKSITIETKTGDMLLKAKGKLVLEAESITVTSKKDTKFDAGSNFEMKAKSNFTLKSGSQMNIEAGSTLTIKGSQVNIN